MVFSDNSYICNMNIKLPHISVRWVWCTVAMLIVLVMYPLRDSCQSSASSVSSLMSVAVTGAQHVSYCGFDVYYSSTWHLPVCVVYELTSSETSGKVPRSGKWWNDKSVKGCAYPEDYTRSGYDRGHMIPAGDLKWSKKAMDDSFVMSNVCPQNHGLNEGGWNNLERKVREWAQREKSVVVFSGPIVAATDTVTLGVSHVRVPSGFYKIIATIGSAMRVVAFIYPNAEADGDLNQYVVTVDEVESLTGIDFFNTLPIDLQQRIESTKNLNYWLN